MLNEENVSLSVGVNLPWPHIHQSKKPKGPVWRYFLEETRDNTTAWICQFCGFIYKNKHATRLQKHVLRCSKASAEAKQVIEEKFKNATPKRRKLGTISKRTDDEDDDYETEGFGSDDNRKCVSSPTRRVEPDAGIENIHFDAKVRRPSVSSAASSPCRSTISAHEFRESDAVRQTAESISSKERRALDKLFARAMYSSGVTFQAISENDEWRAFFKRLRPSYRPPNRKQLCTTLLKAEYARIRAEIDEELKRSNVLCLQSDGWSNRRDEAVLLNFIITTPKPVFYKTVETKYERHTVHYFFKEFENIIVHVGRDKFQACVTDNTSAMVKSTAQISRKYPHITSYTCAAHSINLLVQDILKLPSVETVTKDCVNIVKTVNKNRALKSSFFDIQESENRGGRAIGLQLPATTSKTSWKETFECLLCNVYALQMLCIEERTKKLLKTDVRTRILDEEFWTKVKTVHEMITTPVNWIVLLEGETSCISSVFHAFHQIEDTMKRKLTDTTVQRVFGAADITKIVLILANANKTLKPIHFASYLLDPQYRGCNLNADEDVAAMEFVDAKIRETFSSADDVSRVLDELSNYKCEDGFFKKPFVVDSAKATAPLIWWKGTCTSTKLKSVAEKILSLPATIALTERSFSVQRFIRNIKRNRLKAETARKVSFINYNLHLSKPKPSSFRSRTNRPSALAKREDDETDWETFITEEEVEKYDDDDEDEDEEDDDFGNDGDDNNVDEYTALFEVEEIILDGSNDNERTED